MACPLSVKFTRLASALLCALLFAMLSAWAEDPPDVADLLRRARLTESAQEWQLLCQLRLGRTITPLRLTMSQGTVRYDFLDNGDSITLKLGEKGSTLEENRGGKESKVGPARFDAQVRGTDIRYEDLALRFLYWKDAKVVGDALFKDSRCWKVDVRPPGKGESQYTHALLWIGKEDGGLRKAESYDAKDQWARRFQLASAMKWHGHWLAKSMSIESADGLKREDPQPTYLEIKEVEKGPPE